jgi:hypothetical protein
VSTRGSVVPGKKVECAEVYGEAEQPVDPVSGAEVFQSDPLRVKESSKSGSSSENVSEWVENASHEYAQSRQEPGVLATGQTKPYADPCKDGEEKALDDHRRPRDLIKLSRMSLRRQDRIRIRSKKYRNHTSEGDSQKSTILGVSVSILNVSARAQSMADVGGSCCSSKPLQTGSGIDCESSRGERVELPDGALLPERRAW